MQQRARAGGGAPLASIAGSECPFLSQGGWAREREKERAGVRLPDELQVSASGLGRYSRRRSPAGCKQQLPSVSGGGRGVERGEREIERQG
jgi:hypothetical protein